MPVVDHMINFYGCFLKNDGDGNVTANLVLTMIDGDLVELKGKFLEASPIEQDNMY